ncbi:MAG: hypothetical protein Q4A71_04405 [Actinomycetaceae bacterium]|nr:hypothetical protein [Actinomycetaceae bacterium]
MMRVSLAVLEDVTGDCALACCPSAVLEIELSDICERKQLR